MLSMMLTVAKLGTKFGLYRATALNVSLKPLSVLAKPGLKQQVFGWSQNQCVTVLKRFNQISATPPRLNPTIRQIPSFRWTKLRRHFHHSSTRNFISPSNFGRGPPRLRVYRFSPVFLLFAGIGCVALLFTILPFILTTFFPLIILAIVVHQFKKWKRNSLIKQLGGALRNTGMRTSMRTINSLRLADVERMAKMESSNSEVFKDFLAGIKKEVEKSDVKTVEEVNRLESFVKYRVLEAIETDENGIRSFFLGNDVKTWLEEEYDLELDFENHSMFAGRAQGSLIIMVKYPIYLKSSKSAKRHLANVLIAVQPVSNMETNSSAYPWFLTDIARSNAECKMVIAVQTVALFTFKQFILTDPGKSGEWQSKYDISKTSDGHTEYTIRKF